MASGDPPPPHTVVMLPRTVGKSALAKALSDSLAAAPAQSVKEAVQSAFEAARRPGGYYYIEYSKVGTQGATLLQSNISSMGLALSVTSEFRREVDSAEAAKTTVRILWKDRDRPPVVKGEYSLFDWCLH